MGGRPCYVSEVRECIDIKKNEGKIDQIMMNDICKIAMMDALVMAMMGMRIVLRKR